MPLDSRPTDGTGQHDAPPVSPSHHDTHTPPQQTTSAVQTNEFGIYQVAVLYGAITHPSPPPRPSGLALTTRHILDTISHPTTHTTRPAKVPHRPMTGCLSCVSSSRHLFCLKIGDYNNYFYSFFCGGWWVVVVVCACASLLGSGPRPKGDKSQSHDGGPGSGWGKNQRMVDLQAPHLSPVSCQLTSSLHSWEAYGSCQAAPM